MAYEKVKDKEQELAKALGVSVQELYRKLWEGDWAIWEARKVFEVARLTSDEATTLFFPNEVGELPLYPNLAAEMARHGHDAKTLAELIGTSYVGAVKRLVGSIDFELREAKTLMDTYNVSCEKLFSKEPIF